MCVKRGFKGMNLWASDRDGGGLDLEDRERHIVGGMVTQSRAPGISCTQTVD